MTLSGKSVTVKARHYVVAGGAINSPALLLQSKAPDPNGLLGKRTFLHPTVISAALFAQDINGYAGAPQTIYSDHFMDTQPIDGPVGFKLETPPIYPVLFSTTMAGFGAAHTATMKQFQPRPGDAGLAARRLQRKFGGRQRAIARRRLSGARLPISDAIWDGVKRAMLTMAEIQFAAGAQIVYPTHESASGYTTWAAAKQAIEALPYQPTLTRVVSAHVMGGCPMSDDIKLGLVSSAGAVSRLEQPLGARRFAVPDLDRRQSAIVDLRHHRAAGQRPAEKLTGKPAPSLNASA